MKSSSFDVSLYIIGTELTCGIIEDKHTPFLTSNLTSMGYTVRRSVLLPDDGTIEKSLSLGVKDSSVILITGGLGPTSDDLTRNIIARLAGVELVKDQTAWDTLYKRVGERIYGANEQQTMIPKGFEIIPNPNGTAVGFKGYIESNNKKVLVVSMPGPPREMQPMFFNQVKPMLLKLIGKKELQKDEYSVYLIAEAKLEELCAQVAKELNLLGKVEWGTRFQNLKISLYISGENSEDRKNFIKRLKELSGYGLIHNGNFEAVDLLTERLKDRHLTISCAESATAGSLSKILTEKSGSSDYFWGGVSSYSAECKIKVLGVSKEEIERNGMVTQTCAKQMSEGMLKVSGSDVSISITGIAGPTGEEIDKPLGTVCLGFSSKDKATQTVMLKTFYHSRESSRRRFTVSALVLADLYLQGYDLVDTVSNWKYI